MKEDRLLNMLGEPSVVPLMIYLWRLGYIGLFPGTLRAKWDLGLWLLRADESNPKVKP